MSKLTPTDKRLAEIMRAASVSALLGDDPDEIHRVVEKAIEFGQAMRAGAIEAGQEMSEIAIPEAEEPCQAKLHHGPGHQSTTECEVRGPHTMHVVHYNGGQRATWTDGHYLRDLAESDIKITTLMRKYEKDAMTGFNDEPPEEEDE